MQGFAGCFVLSRERNDARICRRLFLEPGKEGCKDYQDVLF